MDWIQLILAVCVMFLFGYLTLRYIDTDDDWMSASSKPDLIGRYKTRYLRNEIHITQTMLWDGMRWRDPNSYQQSKFQAREWCASSKKIT